MKLQTKKLLMAWATYIVVCSFLTFVNYSSNPNQWWVVWIWAGWGIGQLLMTARYLFYGRTDDQNNNNEQ